MTKETWEQLALQNFRPTPTILELADCSTIFLEGILEDIIVLVDSWEYHADFLALQRKSKLGGHPLIIGRPWLATTNAYISCRSRNMKTSCGDSTKNFILLLNYLQQMKIQYGLRISLMHRLSMVTCIKFFDDGLARARDLLFI